MTTSHAIKNIAKGLALGVLWPAAATVVLSKRASKWIGELGHESLDTAMEWTTAAESGIKEAKLTAEIRWMKKPVGSQSVNEVQVRKARSVGAAANDDPNVTGRRGFWGASKEETPGEREGRGAEQPPKAAPGRIPMKGLKFMDYVLSGLFIAVAAAYLIAKFPLGVALLSTGVILAVVTLLGWLVEESRAAKSLPTVSGGSQAAYTPKIGFEAKMPGSPELAGLLAVIGIFIVAGLPNGPLFALAIVVGTVAYMVGTFYNRRQFIQIAAKEMSR